MEFKEEVSTMKHNRPSSGELAKELFSPRSMLKTKRLLEKALESKKSGSSSSNLYVPDTCNSLNPNDSRDFKDAPRLRKVKLRLKLKSDSNSDKEHQGSSENAPAYDKAQRDRTSSNSSSLVVKKEPGYAESTIDDIDTKDIFTRNLCIKSDNEDQSPLDNGGNSNSNTLWNSSAQTSQVSSIDIVPSESNTTSNSTNRSTCCVCRSCIPSISYEEHLRSCLRERFTKQSGTGPCPAKKNEKQCNICHEAIGHLNSRAQNKHVNNCLDKSEDQKQKENEHKQQLAEAREAVPACPLCAQNFKSHQARKNHLKKCAKDKGMTVDRLKLLMKQQEEDYAAKLDAGILPEEFKGKKKANNSASRDTRKQLSKIDLDEQTQIALALSNSLMSDDNRPDENFVQSVMPSGSKTLQEQTEGPSAKGKKGKQTESNNFLLTMSRERAAERISSRVNRYIFTSGNKPEDIKTPPFKNVSKLNGSKRLSSSPSIELSSQEHISISDDPINFLWPKTSHPNPDTGHQDLSSGADTQPALKHPLLEYYVQDLMPPISPSCVPTGSKIKRVSAIPGRRKSDGVQSSQCNPGPSGKFPVENSSPTSSKSPLLDCEMPPSQTVEDLADLAMESENATNVTFDPRSIHHEHATDDVTSRKSPISTPLSSYGCMLNNSLYSDVSILVAENSCGGQENNRNNSNSNNFRPTIIRAHKIILHVQCPQLLDLCIDECINLSNYDEQAVLCVLAFLYSGSGGVWLIPEYREQVFKLAQRQTVSTDVISFLFR